MAPARLAFLAVVLLGGLNAVAVRVASDELAPLWSATLRFGLAAIILLIVVFAARIPLPRGRALAGSLLYGAVGFAGAFGCIHWALVRVPPASAQTILGLVPLLTLLLAIGQGLERFRPASLIGTIVAFAGVLVVFGTSLGAATPLPSLVAVIIGALCMAESNVIVKRGPQCDPLARIAVAMTVGSAILFVTSHITGESPVLPTRTATWVAVLYIAVLGSATVFSLYVDVVGRWSASTASYVMLLMPIVTILVTSTALRAPVGPAGLIGCGLIVGGVFLGMARLEPTQPLGSPTQPRVAASSAVPGCA